MRRGRGTVQAGLALATSRSSPSMHMLAQCSSRSSGPVPETLIPPLAMEAPASPIKQVFDYQWDIPVAYKRISRRNPSPKFFRHMVQALPQAVEHIAVMTNGIGQLIHEFPWCRQCPPASCWDDIDLWLAERGMEWSTENRMPLLQLWQDVDSWPLNLRLALRESGKLHLPDLPPVDAEVEEWQYYPMPWAPPTLAEGMHKTVPRWGPGWQLHYHGSNVYGVSSCLALGTVLASEKQETAQPAAAEPTPHVTSPTRPSTQCRTTGPVSPEYKTFPSGRFQATPRTPSGKPTGGPIQNVVHGGLRLRLCSTRRTTAGIACGCAPKVAASSLSLTGPLPRRGSAPTSGRTAGPTSSDSALACSVRTRRSSTSRRARRDALRGVTRSKSRHPSHGHSNQSKASATARARCCRPHCLPRLLRPGVARPAQVAGKRDGATLRELSCTA